MRIYFERLLICKGCGEAERQTATNTYFDWIGKLLHRRQIIEFLEEHKKCNSPVAFSSWRVGKYNYLN